MKVRVGLVGLGEDWERRHRPALRALSDRFEVRAVYEHVAQRAEMAAHDFGAQAVEGYHALATREDVDAILMLGDEWYGALPIFAACDAGKAVYCSIGLGAELPLAERLTRRVEEAGVAFMAEFSRRHAAATLRLKELIATRLGQPRLLFCHQRRVAERVAPFGVRPSAARAATIQLVDLIDWCRYVVGAPPTSLVGIAHAGDSGADDYQMLSLDFTPAGGLQGSGAVAQISTGSYVPSGWQEALGFRAPPHLQVSCENGLAFVDLPAGIVWFDSAGRHQESLDNERPVGEMLLASFYRGVTSLVRDAGSLRDTFDALRIVMLARESQRQGRRMPIKCPHDGARE